MSSRGGRHCTSVTTDKHLEKTCGQSVESIAFLSSEMKMMEMEIREGEVTAELNCPENLNIQSSKVHRTSTGNGD